MSYLVVGISHRSADINVLERVALDHEAATKLALAVKNTPAVAESAVLATCNRTEVYATVDRFHAGMDEVTAILSDITGVPLLDLAEHLYVHFEEGAVAHLFQVSVGLDSMVVGESQILGQVKETLRVGQDLETIGTDLNALFQQALRVGKRARAETGIDAAGRSVVSAGLDAVGGFTRRTDVAHRWCGERDHCQPQLRPGGRLGRAGRWYGDPAGGCPRRSGEC
jgi:glutamyl-tRNA reductase